MFKTTVLGRALCAVSLLFSSIPSYASPAYSSEIQSPPLRAPSAVGPWVMAAAPALPSPAPSNAETARKITAPDAPLACSAAPSVTISTSDASPFIGTDPYNFTLRFDNTSATDVGYGPYVNLELPNGADGNDGLTFNNATYLGSSVTPVVSPFTCVAGSYLHPLTGLPTACATGRQVIVLQLPFGSFTADQPHADLLISTKLSALADMSAPISIGASAGFIYGCDPLNNPITDPPIISAVSALPINPTIIRTTKTYIGTEGETATGPNYPRQYRIDVAIAPGQTITNLRITDTLPNNMAFLGVVSMTPAGSVIQSPPVGVAASPSTLVVNFPSATNSASVTFQYFIPLTASTGSNVLPAGSGADAVSLDTANAAGTWKPIDTRDPIAIAASNTATHTLTDQALALQKTAQIITDTSPTGANPGDTIEYTLNFQVSDFVTLDNLVISDTFQDGMRYVAGSAVWAFAERGTTQVVTYTTFPSANLTQDNATACGTSFPPSGTTTLNFFVSDALSSTLGLAGSIVQGGYVITPTAGPTSGVVKFRVKVCHTYSDLYPGQPVEMYENLRNAAVISGQALANAAPYTPTGSYSVDGSAATLQVPGAAFAKSLYSINGSAPTSPLRISPGDSVTYRLIYTQSLASYDSLAFTDFLPLPIYDATSVTSFVGAPGSSSSVSPGVGQATYGPLNTYAGTNPTLSSNAAANSVAFNFGPQNDPANTQNVLDILFTVKVKSDPFADDLFLTNQAQAVLDNNEKSKATQSAIVQMALNEPILSIRKGVISASRASSPAPAPVFSPAPPLPAGVTYTPPGSCPTLSGWPITTTRLGATFTSDLANLDAGDRATYAIVVANTGHFSAWDVLVRDALPSNMTYVAGSLCAQDGSGAALGSSGNLFGSGLTLANGPSGALPAGTTSSGGINSAGTNIAILTFDVLVNTAIQPNATLPNTATLAAYSNIGGGANFVPDGLLDSASITSRPPSSSKAIASTEINTTGNNNVQTVIGEIITYTISITIPEGSMSNARITDTLPSGMAFVDCVGVSAPADVTSSLGAISAANFCADGAAGNPAISSVSGEGGRLAAWNFGSLTNVNTNNAVAETLIVTYTAVALNTAANVAPKTRANAMAFTADGVPAQTSSTTVTIVEPKVSIAKSLTPNTATNGTPVDFDIVLQNVSGVDAWDTVLTDTIPAIFTSPSIASVADTAGIVSASNFNLSGNSLSVTTPFSMTANPARTITIRIHAIVNGVSTNTIYTNTANTAWTSLPNAPGTRSVYNTNSTERTGAGGINNYAAAASTSLDVRTAPFKGITTTSEIHTPGTDVAIGEIVRYRIGITMPQATAPNLQFVDSLPAGMQFVNDGTATIGFISDAGMTSSSLSGVGLNVAGSSALTPISFPMPAANIGVSASGTVITFSLGTVNNTDVDSNDEFVIVEFNALALNTAGNVGGTTLVNNFTQLQSGLSISSSSISARVVEPQVSITKTIDPPAPVDAGDLITYRVHVAAGALPTNTAAFDVALTDTVDANLQIISANLVPSSAAACTGTPKTSSQNISGQVITGYVSCLNTAETAELVIVAQVIQLAKNGATIPNTATLAYNTLPGPNGTTSNPTGSVTPGATGAITGERVYGSSASASTTLATPQIAKLQPTPTQYTIGAVIAYTLVITLPEGTTSNLIVEDDLPSGLGYAGYSMDYSAYNGANTTPSITPAPIGGSGVNPVFTFGDQQTTADNVTTNNTFRIIVLAKALDEPANVAGVILTNTAKLTYADPTSGTTSLNTPPVSVQLVEPKLGISKTAVGQHTPLNAGDLVTYTLTVSNTGSASAYDVVITDALPAGITYLAPIAYAVSAPAGAILTNTNAAGASNLTWQASEIGVGATASIQFAARVAYDIAPNLTLTNTTAATYSTLPGVVSGERATTTPAASAVLQSGQPILQLTKSVTPTVVLPGGYITYTIRVTNTGVLSAVTTITDVVPVNTTFVAATNGATGASAGSGAGALVTWNPEPINANGGAFTAQMVVQVNNTPNATPSSITGYQVVNTAILSGVNVITPTGTVTSTITLLRLGNRVWFDTNDNSVLDGSESGIANVVVELRDSAGNPVNNPLSGLPYIVTTDASGYYTFTNLAAGDYIVRLPASNFAAGGATPGYRVSDAIAAPDPDNNIDNDNNGVANAGGYAQSLPVTLAYGAEPGATLALSDTNSTVDFGLWYPSAVRMEKRASNINPSAGDAFTYYLEITNPGPTTAKNTVITDTLPAGLSLIGVDYANGYTLSGNTLVINVGNIDPGVTRTVNVNVMASDILTDNAILTNTAALTSPNAIATITDTAVVIVRSTADIRLTKFGKPDGGSVAGDLLTYTLVAFNQGPDAATNLIFTDTIATSGGPFAIVSASVPAAPSATCSPNSGALGGSAIITCGAVPSLAAGAQVTAVIVIRADGAGSINDIACATTSSTDPNATNNCGAVERDVTASADVAITKSGPATAVAGTQVTYTLRVTNTGLSPAAGVQVNDTLPAQLSLLSAAPASQCSMVGNALSCLMGTLPANGTALITVTALVNSDVTSGTGVLNGATVSAATYDPNTANNASSASLTTSVSATLALTKTDQADPVGPGDLVVYTLRLTNLGPSALPLVTLTDTLDANALAYLSFVGASDGSCMFDGAASAQLSCLLGNLAAGETRNVQVTFRVAITAPNGTLVGNMAMASALGATPASDEETSVINRPAASFSIAKDVNTSVVEPNGELIYTIYVANNGALAEPVRVTDTLPVSATFNSATCPAPTLSGGLLLCDLTLLGGQTASFQVRMTLSPNAINGQIITNTAAIPSQSATATSSVRGVADVAVTKLAKPDGAVQTGQPITYFVTAINNGQGIATNVYVTDVMAADGLFSYALPSGCAGSPASPTNLVNITCGPLTLAAGAQQQYIVTATPLAGTTSINNVARITADGRDPNPNNNTDSQQRQVTLPADVAVSKTGPASASAGTQVTYTIVVSNAGPNAASAVHVLDTLAAQLALVSVSATQGNCAINANALDCSIGNLVVGQKVTLTAVALVNSNVPTGTVIFNSATATSSTSDANEANNTSTTSLTTGAATTINIAKTGSTSAIAGNSVSYQIVVTNAGPGMATALVVNDVIPNMQWLQLTSATVLNGSGSCSADGVLPGVVCALGDLPAGQTQAIALSFIVKPETPAGTVISDTAVLQSSTSLAVSGNTTVNTAITSAANLAAQKTARNTNPSAGDLLTYDILVSNAGPSMAWAVAGNDTLPAGATLVGVDGALAYTTTAGGVDILFGNLPAGSSMTAQVNVLIPATTTNATVLTNTIAVTSTNAIATITDTAVVIVRNTADIRLTKFGKPDSGSVVGDILTYTLVAFNQGPDAATNLIFTDTIATSGGPFVIVSASVPAAPSATCSPNSGALGGSAIITCGAVPTLAAGAQVTAVIVIRADGAGSINDIACATTSSTDPNSANNCGAVERDVTASADVGITKSGPATAVAGTQVTYTLAVTNTGLSPAAGVQVNDTLPAQLSLLSAAPASQCSMVGNALSCLMGTLPANGTALITVTALVNSDVTSGTVVLNGATVSAATYDPNTANNASSASLTTSVSATLALTKTDQADPVGPGDLVVYTLRLTNLGPSALPLVTLTDTLDANALTYLSFVGASDGSCVFDGAASAQLSCLLGNLAAGETRNVQVTFRVAITAPNGTLVGNTAMASAPGATAASDEETSAINRPAASFSIAKDVNTSVVEPNGELIYTIYVANNGALAEPVRVTDTLPVSATFNSATCPAPTLSGGLLLCDLTIPGGQTASFQVRMTLSPNAINGQIITNTAAIPSQSATATSSVRGVADVAVTKLAKPDGAVQTGQPITYFVTAINNGQGIATNVYVTDVMAADGLFSYALPSGCAGSPASPTNLVNITCGPLTLAAGEQQQFIATATPLAGTTSINNVARIIADGRDPNPNNNTDSQQRQVTLPADVAVSKTGPASASAGTNITYTIVVSNTGPNAASAVQVVDVLPSELTALSAMATQGGCAVSSNAYTCLVGNLSAGQTETITITALVNSNVASGTVIQNSATATSSASDPNTANNASTTSLTVGSMAALSVNKTGDASAVAGQTASYQIVVTNSGPSAATALVVNDVISGMQWLELSSAGVLDGAGACAANALLPGVTCNLGNVGAGQTRTIALTFLVRPDTPAGTTISDTAVAQSATPISVTGNTTASTAITRVADVTLSKSADKPAPSSGEVVKFTLTAHNAGPSVADAVIVTDALPTGLTYVSSTCANIMGTSPFVCWIGALQPGDTASVDVNARVDASVANAALLTNTAALNTGAAATATVQAQNVADVGMQKYGVAAGIINAGDVMTYVIIATNYGPGVAYDTTLSDTLSSDGAYNVTGITGASCAPGAGAYAGVTTFTCDAGTLPPNTEKIITFTMTALGNQTINNVVSASHAGEDPVTANNTASAQNRVRPVADLGIVKTGPAQVVAGDRMTYTLAISNAGPSIAEGVAVNDLLPGGVTLLSAAASQGVCSNSPLACQMGNLAAGATALITVVVKTDSGLLEGATLINSASVSGQTYDPNTANNTGAASTIAQRSSALYVTKVDNADPVASGQLVVYSINIRNDGPSDAKGVALADTLDATAQMYLQYVGATGGACMYTGAMALCSIGDIAAGNSALAQLTFQVKPGVASGMVFSDSLSLAAQTPISLSGDLTETTRVDLNVPPSLLSIVKEADKSIVEPGDVVQFTIRVANNSLVPTLLPVTDTLPAGLTYLSDTCPDLLSSDNPIVCNMLVGAQSVSSFQIWATVSDAATNGTKLANVAQIAGRRPATATVTVRGVADVGIRKDAKPDGAVQTGQPITYYLTAYNNGPGVATNVYVTDTTTSDGTFNMSAAECSPASATGVSALALTCGPLTLANGEQHIFTVVATPTGSARSINNQARIKADGRDPNTSNDTDSQQRQVSVLSDVGVSKVGPAIATAGTPISYTVLVSNTGYNLAQAVNLSDLLPPQIENVSFAATQGGCALNASAWAVNCQLGDVAAGGRITVTVFGVVKRDVMSGTMIVNGAQVTSQSADSNLANNTASAQTLVTDLANVAVNKIASSSSVVAGQVITYQISVANAGPSTAKDVVIHDVISGLAWLSLQSATSGCAADLAGVTCALGDVAPASARLIVLSFAVRADTPAGTVISDVAQIQSASALSVSGTPTATTSVITQPGLRIAKVADKALASTGDVVKFTITTWNAGASVANNVVVTDALPAGLSFINTTCPAPLSADPPVCAVGALWPGQSASFDVNARVMPTVENQTALANVATLNDGQTASAVVLAQNVADLGVEKYGKPDTAVNAGETMIYTIIARNFGPGTAFGPIITDTLASNGAYDILAISGATCSPGTGSYSGATTFTCDLGAPLPAGAERIISMTVRALSNQSLNNTAWIHHNGVDPNPANDLAHVEHQVRPVADVGIRKSGPPTATAGGLITYTLVVTNGGPSLAQGVVVNDFLPGGVTLLSAVSSLGACGASPLQCALGDVAVNGPVFITVTGLADASLPQGTVLLNTATAASATSDSNTGNNTSTASTVITRASVLRVTKVDNLDPVMPGELLRYAIEITNLGPSDAASVRITDTLNGAAAQYLDLTSVTGGACAQNSAVITCNAGDVAAGASHIIEIAFMPKDVTPQGTVFSDSLVVGAATPITLDPSSDLTETTQVNEPHLFLGNRVWYDTNNNGLLDDGAEFGVDGVRVELYKDTNMNEFFDPGVDEFVEYTTTSGGGFYLFNDVVAGDYFVALTSTNFAAGGPLQNYLPSTPVDLNTNNNVDNNNNGETIGALGQAGYVAARMVSMQLGMEPQTLLRPGDTNRTVDFGFYQLNVGNRVWNDLNRNALDDGEPGLPGVPVTLTNLGSGAVFTTMTDANGYYTFTSVPSGTYVISVTLPAGYISINDGALPADAVNADDDGRGTSGGTVGALPFALTPGAEPVVTPSNGKTANWNVDFGAALPIVIGNHVWFDTLSRDGIYAPSDINALGVVVELYKDVNGDGLFSPTIDLLVMTTTTDAGGYYTMSVLPGAYFAVITASNFMPGGVLQGYHASGPVSTLDERNHGVEVGSLGDTDGYVMAAVLTATLGGGGATTTMPNDTYPTRDFAFSNIPTAIDLAYFGAAPVCEGAEIRWQTLRENGTAGYLIYRAEGDDFGSAERVSQNMVAAEGNGTSYAVVDAQVKAGRAYTYWLVEVSMAGDEKAVASAALTTTGCVAGP